MNLHRIETVDDLHRYLRAALQLEHATIPPYLTALYSLHPVSNEDAARVLRVVLVEEMLHLTLVANVMNAVGVTPDLTATDFVPAYPALLPDGETDFEVGIAAFTPASLDTFLHIERPGTSDDGAALVARDRAPGALLPVSSAGGADLHFFSIGEFYAEIVRGLRRLDNELTANDEHLFVGDPSHQVTPDAYYSGGGALIAVKDLHAAVAAIELIGEQGEGLGGDIYDRDAELSHYYRFQQLQLGRHYRPGDVAGSPTGPSFAVEWDRVYPVKANATIDDYPDGSALRAAVVDFNSAYHDFLSRLTDAFSGRPELLTPAVGDMFRIRDLALQIVRSPIPGDEQFTGAPIFGSIDLGGTGS